MFTYLFAHWLRIRNRSRKISIVKQAPIQTNPFVPETEPTVTVGQKIRSNKTYFSAVWGRHHGINVFTWLMQLQRLSKRHGHTIVVPSM